MKRTIKYEDIQGGTRFVIGSATHSIDELPTMHRLKEEWHWINSMYLQQVPAAQMAFGQQSPRGCVVLRER